MESIDSQISPKSSAVFRIEKNASSKLLDTTLKTNNFDTFKKEIKSDHKVSIIASFGKMRIGKSTFQNILISEWLKIKPTKFFIEESNTKSVTNGADYCILTNSNKKQQKVLLDCEGYGNDNNSEVMRLLVLVSAISDIIMFHVDKAFEDETFISFISQTIEYCIQLELPVPVIYVLLRDTSKKALENLFPENKERNPESNIEEMAHKYFHQKFVYKDFLFPQNILFVPPPLTDDEGDYDTTAKTSNFYKKVMQIANQLATKTETINRPNIDLKENKMKFAMKYDFSKLNDNDSLKNYQMTLIDKLVNENFQKVFTDSESISTLDKILLNLDQKKELIKQSVVSELKRILLDKNEPLMQHLTDQIDEKINAKKETIQRKYKSKKTEYEYQRELTRETVVDYETKYIPAKYYHSSTSSSIYCTSCKTLWNSTGCTYEWYHSGGRRWFMWAEWHTCCNARWSDTGCKKNYFHSGEAKWLYDCCKKQTNDNGCQKIDSRNEKIAVGSHQNYKMGAWNENLFSFTI